jgi:hypothetical protein
MSIKLAVAMMIRDGECRWNINVTKPVININVNIRIRYPFTSRVKAKKVVTVRNPKLNRRSLDGFVLLTSFHIFDPAIRKAIKSAKSELETDSVRMILSH